MPAKIIRDMLLADSNVVALVNDKIGQLIEQQDQAFPYVVLSVTAVEPQNVLTGFVGTDRCEVKVECWAFTYKDANTLASTCRTSLQNAGYICVSHSDENFDFADTLGAFRVGYTFQVWK